MQIEYYNAGNTDLNRYINSTGNRFYNMRISHL